MQDPTIHPGTPHNIPVIQRAPHLETPGGPYLEATRNPQIPFLIWYGNLFVHGLPPGLNRLRQWLALAIFHTVCLPPIGPQLAGFGRYSGVRKLASGATFWPNLGPCGPPKRPEKKTNTILKHPLLKPFLLLFFERHCPATPHARRLPSARGLWPLCDLGLAHPPFSR